MKRTFKGLCLLLATIVAIAFTGCESNAGKTVVNTGERQTFNFGVYAQNLVTDEALLAELSSNSTVWQEGKTTVGATTYERVVAKPISKNAKFSNGTAIVEGETYYFSVDPIEWIVLSEGDTSVLLAKNILDVSVFQTNTETDDDGNYPNNWELSVLRSFMNGGFASSAFTAFETAAIESGKVVSSYPQSFYKAHSTAIKDTWDKVFALSYSETVSTEYGFSATATDYDALRMAKPTDYARAKGAYFYVATAREGDEDYERDMYFNGNGEYWLRTVGWEIINAGIVRYTGEVGKVYKYVDTDNTGVRPAIKVGIAI